MSDEHGGHRARMRERFSEEGLSSFAPHEVLELMLFYAIPQRNVNPIAHALINRFGTLENVLRAPKEELCKVDGVGEYAASLLKLFHAAALRLNADRASAAEALTTSGEAAEYCAGLLRGFFKERFFVVCLDAQLRVLKAECIAEGSVDEVPAYPRLAVEAALRHNARQVILCHNHPGGTAYPSQADLIATRRLCSALRAVQIQVPDHLIVTEEQVQSFAALGLMPDTEGEEE